MKLSVFSIIFFISIGSFPQFMNFLTNNSCLDDEFFSSSSGRCMKCSSKILNCLKCTENDTQIQSILCLTCPENYTSIRDTNNVKIISCVPSCVYGSFISDIINNDSFNECQSQIWGFSQYDYLKNDLRLNTYYLRNTSEKELAALKSFYNNLNGDLWINNLNWNIGDPCGNFWYGITCNIRGNIIGINFNMNNLRGIITQAIYDLEYLKFFIIVNNTADKFHPKRNMIFSFPDGLNPFKYLKEFTLRDTDLQAVINIPNFINNIVLEIFDISHNKIKGNFTLYGSQIESLKTNNTQFNLKILDASNNLLDDILKDLFFFPTTLQIIKLNNNNLTGEFPILINHKVLKVLDLRNNNLIGNVDRIYFSRENYVHLDYIGFYFNNVTGHLICKNNPLCLKRSFKNKKILYDPDLRFTQEELEFLRNMMQKFDLIGSPINLNYKGRTVVKTPYGGFLSLMSLIIIIFLISFFFIPFITRPISRLNYSLTKLIDPKSTYLNKSEFFLAVNIINTNSTIKTQLIKYLSIKIRNVKVLEDQSGQIITSNSNITLSDYTKTHDELLENYFNLNNITKITRNRLLAGCRVANLDNIYLQGSIINKVFSYLNIQISINADLIPEDKSSNTFNLPKKAFIDLLLKNSKILIIYSDINIDMDNYAEPIKRFISLYSVDLNFQFTLGVTLQFISNLIRLDNNYFLDEISDPLEYLMHYQTSSSVKNFFNPDEDLNRLLFDIDILKTKYEAIYRRYYQKLTEVLSSLGGTIIFFYFTLYLLGSRLVCFQMQTQLIEDLYDIDFFKYSDQESLEKKNGQIKKKYDSKNIHYAVKSYINILERREEEKNYMGYLGQRSKRLKSNSKNEEDYVVNFIQDKFNLVNNLNHDPNHEISSKKINQRKSQNHIQQGETQQEDYSFTVSNLNNARNNFSSDNLNKEAIISLTKEKNKRKKKIDYKIKKEDVFFKSDSFNFVDFIMEFFESKILCRDVFKNRRVNLFDLGRKEMSQIIAINNLVRKFYEIDLMKYFILNKDQINLFRLVTLPQIGSLDNYTNNDFEKVIENYRNIEIKKDSEWKDAFIHSSDENLKNDIFKSYIAIIEKNKKTIIDNKLLKCIEKNVEEFIISSDNQNLLKH